jgi:hypothetical protein
MAPESAEDNRIALYRAKNFPAIWEFHTTLVEGQFCDHALFAHDNAWWLLAGDAPVLHNKLRLFYADNLNGPWLEHVKSPLIDDDARRARPGGQTLLLSGELIRWAQDCAPTYGSRLNAFCITTLSRTEYAERPFAGNPILAAGRSPWAMHGMHHVDVHQLSTSTWLACVDGYNRKLRVELAY